MLKELGFTKQLTSTWNVAKGLINKATQKGFQEKVVSQVTRTTGNVKKILGEFGIKTPDAVGAAAPSALKQTVKKPGFSRGLAAGVGVGTVGTMGMGALFGKKRNSPYYP